jgi:hypothetical protein
MLTGRPKASGASSGYMTRFLLTLLIIGLFALAMLGACLEVMRGKRPAILSRRAPAIA